MTGTLCTIVVIKVLEVCEMDIKWVKLEKMKLPIDIVPGTNPPQFKWSMIVDMPGGPKTIEFQECIPSYLEKAVETLIDITKQQQLELVSLREQVQSLEESLSQYVDEQ